MTTITYKVTVATGTTQYGTGNRFYINGELAPVLYLQEGNTYIFDQSDSSNNGHPLRFSTTAGGTHGGRTEYTTGVDTTVSGQVKISPTSATPDSLHYYCHIHHTLSLNSNFFYYQLLWVLYILNIHKNP